VSEGIKRRGNGLTRDLRVRLAADQQAVKSFSIAGYTLRTGELAERRQIERDRMRTYYNDGVPVMDVPTARPSTGQRRRTIVGEC